jgi:hypothetical protein
LFNGEITLGELLKSTHRNSLSRGSLKARPGFAVAIVVVAAIFWTALFASVSLRILPPIDGALFPLSIASWFPYRDYYFPTTPGSYFIARIAGYGPSEQLLLNFRIIGLVFVPFFFWTLYRLGRLNLSPMRSVLIACFGMSLMFKLGIEVLGGWNLIPLVLFSAGFTLVLVNMSNSSVPTWQINSTNFRLFVAGGCFGLSIVFKHTFFIQLIVAFLIYLLLGALLHERGFVRKQLFSKDMFWIVFGFLTPLSAMSYWLISNSLLVDFFNNISAMGGKNPQLSLLVASALNGFLNAIGNSVSLAFLALLLVGSAIWRENPRLEIGAYVVGIFLFIYLSETLLIPKLESTALMLISVYFTLFIATAVIVLRKSDGEIRFRTVVKYGMCLGIVLQLGALLIQLETVMDKVLILALSDLVFVGMTFILGLSGIVFLSARPEQAQLMVQKSKFELKSHVFVLTIAISSLINVASSGGSIYLLWMIGPFIWLFGRFLTHLELDRQFVNFGVLVLSLSAIANVSFGIDKPYNWHNWTEPSLLSEARSTELPKLSGILAATDVADFYEKLHLVEKKAAKLSKKEDPKIFSLGGIPMSTAISGLSPYEYNYCKFQWMDLCPQKVLGNDLEAIQKKSPDVIVIERIPSSVISLHEGAFLQETSEIRKYYSYAYSQERLGKWVKAGTIRNTSRNLVVSVYYSTE